MTLACEAKQAIAGRNDVLDLGTGLGLEQWDAVDQDRLVRNERAHRLQFGQSRPRPYAGLQDGDGFQRLRRREQRKIIERAERVEWHMSIYIDFIDICR